jgi:hypothetical protein
MWNIKQPRVISDAVGRDCEWLADFDGPLIDHVLKGHDVQLLGRTRLGSCACFQLRIRLKNGDMVDVYIDSTSFLEICQRITRANGSAVVHFDQYQLVGKLKYPHLVTIDNGAQIQRYTVEHIEINPQLQADRFEHIQP